MQIKYYTLYVAAIVTLSFVILQSLLGLDLSWQVGEIEFQFITSIFAHGSLSHFLGNMFSLLLFGLILEGKIGSKNLLYVLLLAGVVGNLAAIGSYNSVLGISGGIYGLIGALMILRPKMVIWISGLPMPMVLVGIAYGAIDLLGALAPVGNTGHLAHLAGLGVGVIAGFMFRDDFSKPKNKTRLSKHQKQAIDNQLDMYEQRYLR
jgi:membrane associated rhomboid family serine protease